MAERIAYAVGAHEPIFHRMRTGNSTAEEWARWERETSEANLDLLGELGVTHAHIACCKGFGLEYEKPLIERAARFAEAAAARGITTGVYVQGWPVYYETFLKEVPEAVDWFARDQYGEVIPWGAQTFRRWIDPTREAFHEYQWRLLEYVLHQLTPTAISMDNTVPAGFCYTESSLASWRAYLRERFDQAEAVRQLGIPDFDCVDLPRFDPIYFPPDAMRVVKDPLLQEWSYWRSKVTTDFLTKTRDLVHRLSPETKFNSGSGCDCLRYNALFSRGVDFDDRFASVDSTGMEESGWRPGAHEADSGSRRIVMDQRIALSREMPETVDIRIATDSRFWKIADHYGRDLGGGFWGETNAESKKMVLCHNFAFARNARQLGRIGPLAAAPEMLDDIREVIDWGNDHVEILTGRGERIAPIAVWRGTVTLGFLRHQPVWEACVVEQMLYENHLPFTIVLDGSLKAALEKTSVLILPGTACISDAQVELITRFVEGGGRLLLLGQAGTRDERTRLRRRHAFEHLFGEAMPDLEFYGPPHWVPELDLSALPDSLRADYGRGKAALVGRITPQAAPDLTRDFYSPFRKVAPKDILPPGNEAEIMAELAPLAGDCLRVTAPRWTLCEFWRHEAGTLVCLANLSLKRPGGPVTIELGPVRATAATVHAYPGGPAEEAAVSDGKVELPALERFAAVVLR
jgi:hypothetical protein